MRPLLKSCGLMRQEDVTMCCRMGVAICGFVTAYPLDVPWNLTREQCAPLIRSVSPPAKSCIVTGGDREKIISLALALESDLVQLHYHETLEDTAAIIQALAPYRIGSMLGGGITPENCQRIVLETKPDLIDIMTGVETAPGIKAKEKMAKLLFTFK